MNRAKRKKINSYLDAADVPIINPNRPLYDAKTDAVRPNVKLRSLVDQERYEEARTLFIEIVKSNKYHFKNLWKIGIEIIGKSSPKDLIGYLKAVYTSSPPSSSAEIFNVYMDEMMIEEKWEKALEEMQLLYDTALYHHPIMLRNMAICAYNLWKKSREKLPESYFEEDQHDPFDLNITQYEKHVRVATNYLAEAHRTYLRDAELLDFYFDFLKLTGDNETAKKMVLESLEVCKREPEYYLLFTLLRINKVVQVFDSRDYILQLYEFDPYLSSNEMQLDQYCKQQCIEIIQTLDDIDSTQEQLANAYETSLKIFKLYIFRLEHGNPEEWFQEVVIELFQGAMSEMMVNVYYERQVNYLLRSPFIKNKIQGDWTHLIDLMNDIVTKYDCWTKSKKRRVDVEEEEEEFEYEEEEEFEYEEEEVHVEECERESFM